MALKRLSTLTHEQEALRAGEFGPAAQWAPQPAIVISSGIARLPQQAQA
jgi:hypothetical protein